MGTTKKNWLQIDNLYAIGTFLVILGHSHSSDWESFAGTILNPLIEFIYLFHMPLFFFVAGFLLMNSDKIKTIGYCKWLSNKALRLLTPYVALSVLAMFPKYYVETGSFIGMPAYMLKALFIPRIGVWGHFWFLPVLLIFYSIFGVYKAKLEDSIHLFAALLVTGVLYFIPISTQVLGLSDIKEFAFYFVLGMFFRTFVEKRPRMTGYKKMIAIIILLLLSMILYKMAYSLVIAKLLVGVLMLAACWLISDCVGERSIMKWISRHNFTIYIYSWPCQAVVMAISSKLGLVWYMTMGLMFLAGVVGPILMIVIYGKLRFLNNRFFDLLLGVK